MTWRIRTASASDADGLALVGGATFLESFAGVLAGEAIVAHCRRAHSAAAYRRYFDAGAEAWLVETEVGQAPVGYALLARHRCRGAGGTAAISSSSGSICFRASMRAGSGPR